MKTKLSILNMIALEALIIQIYVPRDSAMWVRLQRPAVENQCLFQNCLLKKNVLSPLLFRFARLELRKYAEIILIEKQADTFE